MEGVAGGGRSSAERHRDHSGRRSIGGSVRVKSQQCSRKAAVNKLEAVNNSQQH